MIFLSLKQSCKWLIYRNVYLFFIGLIVSLELVNYALGKPYVYVCRKASI